MVSHLYFNEDRAAQCGVAVSLTSMLNTIVLGQTFMRNYYVSLDYTTEETIIAPTSKPPKENEITTGMTIMFVGSWVFVAVFLGGPMLFSLKNCTKKKPRLDYSTYMDATFRRDTD